MTVKNRTLQVLENHKGQFFSGEELAQQLNVSRTSIWKAIKALQEEGYHITAVPNKGYSLSAESDIISKQSVGKYLGTESIFDIEVFKTIDSTNDMAKLKASQGAKEGTVIIAEEQTKGKGRNGRSFFSPTSTGIYLSLILRPRINAKDSLCITTAAAVAVAKSIEKITKQEAKIKWVNDIYIGDKKVCGILTEAAFNLEAGGLEYAVLGIGINVKTPKDGFPKELRSIATTLGCEKNDIRSILIAEILKNFWHYYENLTDKEYLQEYRERCMALGKEVLILSQKQEHNETATALDITEDFGLLVKTTSGEEKVLSSGEISIKM